MKKEPQLFVKKENGRYEKYVQPKVEDNKLYRKFGNKYVPVSMLTTHDLGEGVWVVKRVMGLNITRSDYLHKQYQLEKVADLQNPLLQLDTAKLGQFDKIVESVMYDRSYDTRTWQDKFKLQVAEIIYQLTGKKV